MTTIIYERHEAREAAEHWVNSLGLEDGADLDFLPYTDHIDIVHNYQTHATLQVPVSESLDVHATEWSLEELDQEMCDNYPDLIAFTTEGGFLQIRRIWTSSTNYRWYAPPNEATPGYHMTDTLSIPLGEWEKAITPKGN